jgi:uncharacterized protein
LPGAFVIIYAALEYNKNMKREEVFTILQKHESELRKKFFVQSLSLFGSVARDEARPDSDIDLL